jgi:shikimate kinase
VAGVNRIALVGARGVGKTTVGRALAVRLGWAFADADDLVEAAAGKTIARIFAEDGEPAFRDLEARAVAELCGRENIVIATGGGAVVRDETRSLLSLTSFVVWLTASVDVMLSRQATDPTTAARRPALTALPGRDEVVALLAAREQHYRAVAELTVDTTNVSPDELAADLARSFPGKGRPA